MFTRLTKEEELELKAKKAAQEDIQKEYGCKFKYTNTKFRRSTRKVV